MLENFSSKSRHGSNDSKKLFITPNKGNRMSSQDLVPSSTEKFRPDPRSNSTFILEEDAVKESDTMTLIPSKW